jgi:hypothetical protein
MRGGVWGFFEDKVDANGNPIPTEDLTTQGNQAVEEITGKVNSSLNNVESSLSTGIDTATQQGESLLRKFNPFGNDTPVSTTPAVGAAGGRRKSRQMKGGRSNVGLSYYAAPVTDSVTAHPTYMMKYNGGKRRTCKRKGCKKRKSCRHRSRRR